MMAPVQRRPMSSLARWNRAQSAGRWGVSRILPRIPPQPYDWQSAS